MKRITLLGFALLLGSGLYAQSKKELLAEVDKLKSETAVLKAQIEELKKPKEISLTSEHDKASYGLGVLMSSNIRRQGADSLVVDALTAGINDVLKGKTLKMQEQECSMVVQQYMTAAMEKKMAKVKEEGTAFLNTNKTQPGVMVTASGLQYKKINEGKGKQPTASQSVTVHYTGKLVDGTVFDSSVERGSPATFNVDGVIAGWTEALQLMHEGDKWTLYIPSELAYGERGAGGQIPPYATLIFDVELIKVN